MVEFESKIPQKFRLPYCGGLRRFGESDPKDQLRINNRVCVAEALRNGHLVQTFTATV